MIKVVSILRRRDDVPADEFHKYCLESYAPLVLSVAKDLRARRYVQSHTIDTELGKNLGMSDAFEGIAELWWDSLADIEAAAATPECIHALQALAEDEARFIDRSRSTIFLTEEHVILEA